MKKEMEEKQRKEGLEEIKQQPGQTTDLKKEEKRKKKSNRYNRRKKEQTKCRRNSKSKEWNGSMKRNEMSTETDRMRTRRNSIYVRRTEQKLRDVHV